jgi:hypothetical protein
MDAPSLDSDDDPLEVFITHSVLSDEMLIKGLKLFFDNNKTHGKKSKMDRVMLQSKTKQVELFVEKYNLHPSTLCTVYEDLQRTQAVEMCSVLDLRYFLIAMNFLNSYPKQHTLESDFDYSRGYIARIIWRWVTRIASLESLKIVFPQYGPPTVPPTYDDHERDLRDDDMREWILTVDCIHYWVRKDAHPMLDHDPGKSSFKWNHDGRTVEFGIALDGGLIWKNGPDDAGLTNDLGTFRKPNGLKEQLERVGKLAIGDRGYRGEECISVYNSLDSKAVKMFKRRALLRHETFNGLTRTFDILDGRFRHDNAKFEIALTAVCVLCNYKVEYERPLFDILVQAVIDADNEHD